MSKIIENNDLITQNSEYFRRKSYTKSRKVLIESQTSVSKLIIDKIGDYKCGSLVLERLNERNYKNFGFFLIYF